MEKIFTYRIDCDDCDPNQIHGTLQGVINEIDAVINTDLFNENRQHFTFEVVAEKVMTQEEYDNLPVQ